MQIVISNRAKGHLQTTAEYIRKEFGSRSEQKFKLAFFNVIGLLADNPYLGPIEPLLADLPSNYRSIVVARQNKIVYRIVDNRIEIADFWDCRREPKALADQVR